MGTEKNLAGIYGGIGGGDRYTNPDKSIVTPVCDFLVVSPMSFFEICSSCAQTLMWNQDFSYACPDTFCVVSFFDPLVLGCTPKGAKQKREPKKK